MYFYPYPLGLPRGTVRAIITLLFMLSTSYLILIDKHVSPNLISTFLVLCALYYGMRKEKSVISQDKSNRQTSRGETAFGLPAFTVRVTIFMILIILSVKILYFGTTSQDFSTSFYIIVYIIAGFLIGTILEKLGGIFGNDPFEQNLLEKIFFHGKAIIVILLSLITNYFYIIGETSSEVEVLEVVTAIFIGFYFGNR
ncbi:MAG: hypothetical protein ACFFD1_14900 [Candidatus Thorarchaeota archaeon]